MGKHKKQLRSEKAKVKLKGNKLSKAQNVTKTDFKVKKIIIKDQILETSLDDDGRKKHNLKEILSKLKHHNFSFRIDSLKMLKDYITTANIIELNLSLGSIVHGLSSMCVEPEKDIRRETFKILSILFSLIPSTRFQPYFEVILSYLNCAMNHIQQDIQDDSLFMMDILIRHQSKLIAIYNDKIFNNFLDMISKVTNSQNRTLVISMGNKLSAVKWRSKILQRINELLKTTVNYHIDIDPNLNNNKTAQALNQNQHNFNTEQEQHFNLLRHQTSNSSISCTSTLFHGTSIENISKSSNDCEKLQKNIEIMIPLLFNSWLEVSPLINQQILSNSDAAFTLKQIIDILESLWKLILIQHHKINNTDLIKWFTRKYLDDFKTNIFSRFPYQQQDSWEKNYVKETKGNQKKSQSNEKDFVTSGGQMCIFQNFMIIHLYCEVASEKLQTDYDSCKKNLNFLIDSLSKLKNFNTEEIIASEKALRTVILTKGKYFMKTADNETRILLKTILNTINDHSNKEFRNKMFTLVCDIILNEELYQIYGENEFQEWIMMLPRNLCKTQISYNTLKTLSTLAKQKNLIFLCALKNGANFIIKNLSSIHVIGCKDNNDGKRLIVNLFFWIPNWSEDEKNELWKNINENIDDHKIIEYFRFVIDK